MISLRSRKSTQLENGDWVFEIELVPVALDAQFLALFRDGLVVGNTLTVDGRQVRVLRVIRRTEYSYGKHETYHLVTTSTEPTSRDFAPTRASTAESVYGSNLEAAKGSTYTLPAEEWYGRQMNAFEDGWDAAVEFFVKKDLLKIVMDYSELKEGAEKRAERVVVKK